jgi:hypothetical protein
MKVTIGDGKNTMFWDSPWLDGLRPKDIAPLIHAFSVVKRATVFKTLSNNSWVTKINCNTSYLPRTFHNLLLFWED